MHALLKLGARCLSYGSAVFMTAMMLITVADVSARALFNTPITGAYDLVQLFLVATVFLSIPDVFLRDENIVIDLVDHVAGRPAVALLRVVANLAGFVFLAVLSWQMITPALDALRFHEVAPDLAIPMIVHWSLMIAGIALSLPAAGFMLLASVRALAPARDVP